MVLLVLFAFSSLLFLMGSVVRCLLTPCPSTTMITDHLSSPLRTVGARRGLLVKDQELRPPHLQPGDQLLLLNEVAALKRMEKA